MDNLKTDPVVYAKFREATKEESKKGITYYTSIPLNLLRKISGTIDLVFFKGANPLAWDRTYFETGCDKLLYYSGFKPEECFMRTFKNFFIGEVHLIDGSDKVLKAFFKHHRNDGLFSNSFSIGKFLGILQKTFPEDNISSEDFMLTCSPKNTKLYRKLLHQLLIGENLREFASTKIFPFAQKVLKEWGERCLNGESINVTEEARFYASNLITQLIFGEESSNKEITEAIDFVNAFITKSFVKKPTEEDQKKLNEALKIFKETVEKILENENLPLFATENTLTIGQKKALIFMVFFAGQETTASLLAYEFDLLARSSESQERLYEALKDEKKPPHKIVDESEVVMELFNLSCAKFPPVYGLSRSLLEKDICLEYRLATDENNVIRKKIFHPQGILLAGMWQKAQSVLKNKEKLDYEKWFLFGGGVHKCPGAKLAVQEINQFVIAAVAQYHLTTEQKTPPTLEGRMTLKTKDDIWITLKRREKPLVFDKKDK